MASFSVEEFIGNGILKGLLQMLLEEGWDDVPTLKIMSSEDMDLLHMSQKQKDALGIRSYLHDRGLMQYADKMEDCGKNLSELLNLSTMDLSTQFEMKRGHIARFINRIRSDDSFKLRALAARRRSMMMHRDDSIPKSVGSNSSNSMTRSHVRSNAASDTLEQSMVDMKIKEGYVFKGIVAAEPAEPRACGCVNPPPISDQVAPYGAIENISVQKLTPEYKIGMEPLVKTKAPPLKASELWRDKPAVFLCLRRPGCIMCRAEAHQLYSRKPLFDALGVQLFAVLHEQIESEVKDFWPRYWGGVVLLDRGRDFFKALGGGKLLKEKFLSGFLLNPRALSNYKRAKAMDIDYNFKGEGEIKGGLFIIGRGKSGIAYQFIERNFGDWAPLAEVIEICTQMQYQPEGQRVSVLY
ncbi:PRX-like2 domain-containing protein [Spatholobus suberectus]|nr:PRX-like2 domain-containing protein [Spatholobus suberectus]